jgi:hypothetical protein
MRTSTAYFAGAGTVMAAIAAGLGGGLLMGNIVSSKTPPQEMTRLEQRMASQRSQAAPPVEPAQAVPAAGMITASNSPVPAQPQPDPAPPPRNEPANAPVPAPPQTAAVTPASITSSAPEPASAQPEAKRQTARAPEDSMARSRDADLRRVERRRERSQRWTERRRPRQDQELREVEQAVRDDTEQPKRAFAAEPVRSGLPVIKLFGEE